MLSSLIIGCTSLGDLSQYSTGTSAPSDPERAPGAGGSGTSTGAALDAGSTLGGEGIRPTEIDQPGAPLPTSAPTTDAAPPEPAPAIVTLARFVRLVADADVNESPFSSAAELSVLDETGALLDRTGWIATADSAETEFAGGASAAFAIDADPITMWHTPWFDPAVQPPHPHFLQVDLGSEHRIGGFVYLPRQDESDDGSITDYRFFLSADGVEWGEPLARGRFDASKTAHEVLLEP
ncbi:MAG: discoidin domain-containing protein [Polyangiaceae bacterium]